MLPSLDEAFKVVEQDAAKKTIVELVIIMVENKNPRIRQKAAESLAHLDLSVNPPFLCLFGRFATKISMLVTRRGKPSRQFPRTPPNVLLSRE